MFSQMPNRTATLVLVIAIAAVAASGNIVFADSCVAQLSYPIMPSAYSSNVQLVVPVSATCTPIGNALTAVGSAYDTSVNANVGTVNTLLSSATGGTFNGQLIFNLPPTSLGHSVQILVSIYSGGQTTPGQYGALLTTVSETVQLNPNSYQNSYYPPNQYYPQQQQITTVTSFITQLQQPPMRAPYLGGQTPNASLIQQQQFGRASYLGQQNANTSWLVVLVAVIIAASVIVALVFAVIATRNRPQPRPPTRRIPPKVFFPRTS